MPLFGSYDLIWRGGRRAAERDRLLVTLSPNCSVDSERWSGQSEVEATHSGGEACSAR